MLTYNTAAAKLLSLIAITTIMIIIQSILSDKVSFGQIPFLNIQPYRGISSSSFSSSSTIHNSLNVIKIYYNSTSSNYLLNLGQSNIAKSDYAKINNDIIRNDNGKSGNNRVVYVCKTDS